MLRRLALVIALAVVTHALAFAQFAPASAFHFVYVSPDRFIAVYSDAAYPPVEAGMLCDRLRTAWNFDLLRDGLRRSPLFDWPLTIRVSAQMPRNIFGYAANPQLVFISLPNLKTNHSVATFAHELTHVQDFRLLRGGKVPTYLIEGRAVANAIAFRRPMGLFPDFKDIDMRRCLLSCTSADVRTVFGMAPGQRHPADLQFKVESLGCYLLEYLRIRGNHGAGFSDIQPRSTHILVDVARGINYDDAFMDAFRLFPSQLTEELANWFDRTQSMPEERLRGTAFEGI